MNDNHDTIAPPANIPPSQLTYDGPKGPLFKALAEARKHFLPLAKDGKADVSKDGKYLYSFTYSPLDAVLDALAPGLQAAGLALLQPFDGDTLYTIVACGDSSLTVETPLPGWDTPQQLGSLLTYLRRYQVKGIFGVADAEDDDGNAASGNKAAITRKEPTVPQASPKSSTSGLPKELLDKCVNAGKSAELTKAEFEAACQKATGKLLKEFSSADAETFLSYMADMNR